MNIGEILANVQKEHIKQEENFKIGSVINVHFKITEGKRERIQHFQGTVIDMHGAGTQRMIKVRKLVGQIGVERTFPLQSPSIAKIEFVKQGKARRAKLFYLRDRIGKQAQLENVKTVRTQA